MECVSLAWNQLYCRQSCNRKLKKIRLFFLEFFLLHHCFLRFPKIHIIKPSKVEGLRIRCFFESLLLRIPVAFSKKRGSKWTVPSTERSFQNMIACIKYERYASWLDLDKLTLFLLHWKQERNIFKFWNELKFSILEKNSIFKLNFVSPFHRYFEINITEGRHFYLFV